MLRSALSALLALFVSFTAQALEFPFVPDGKMTTGSLCSPESPDFIGYRYEEQIAYCRRHVETRLKAEVYRRYGIGQKCAGQYIIDHFIPLSMGGSNTIDNLWPEANAVRALRDQLEQATFDRLSTGEITQAQAVRIIVTAKLNPPVKNPDSFEFCR